MKWEKCTMLAGIDVNCPMCGKFIQARVEHVCSRE